jgi:hypothetical protein
VFNLGPSRGEHVHEMLPSFSVADAVAPRDDRVCHDGCWQRQLPCSERCCRTGDIGSQAKRPASGRTRHEAERSAAPGSRVAGMGDAAHDPA